MVTIQPAHKAPANTVHGNSMQAKFRAVLERGLSAEWTSHELRDLLGISERSAQELLSGPLLKSYAHPTKGSEQGRRRASGLAVLLYLTRFSDEITAEDVLPALKKMLPLLTDAVLEGVISACKALISKRSGMPVIVKTEPRKQPQSAPAATDHEFPFMRELTAPEGHNNATHTHA